MTLTARAFSHNPQVFLSELHSAAAARTMAGARQDAAVINRTIIELETDQLVENEWTLAIAKRLLHDTSS